jgi:SSS family solute:Na+ symporter
MSALQAYAAVVAFVVLILVVSLSNYRTTKAASMSSFFLGDRALGPVVAVFTISATIQSAFTFIGVPGFAYLHGVGIFSIVVPSLLFGPVFYLVGRRVWALGRTHSFVNLPDLLSARFDNSGFGALLAIVLLFPAIVLISTQFQGAGYLFAGLTQGAISYTSGVVILVVLILIYTSVAGFKGVVKAHVVEGIVKLVAIYLATGVIVYSVASGPADLLRAVQRDSQLRPLLSVPGPQGFYTIPTMIAFNLIFGIGNIVQPPIFQRIYAAASPNALKAGAVGYGFAAVAMFVPAFFIGVSGRVAGLQVAPDEVLMTLVRQHLPVWLTLVLLFGALSAILATVAAMVLSLSSLFVRDIYMRLVDERPAPWQMAWLNRGSVVGLLLIAIALSTVLPPGLVGVIVNFQGPLFTLAATLAILSLFWPGANVRGATAALIAGGVFYFIVGVAMGHTSYLGMHMAVWMALVGTFGTAVLSAATARSDENARAAAFLRGRLLPQKRSEMWPSGTM